MSHDQTWSIPSQHCTAITTCDQTEGRNLSSHLDLCVSSVTQKISQKRLRIVTQNKENIFHRHAVASSEKKKRHGNRSSTSKNVTRCSVLVCVLPNCIPSSLPLHPMHSKTHFLCMVFSSIRSFRTKRASGQTHCVFDSSLRFKDSARRTFVVALEYCSWLTILHMFWKAMILCSTPRARDCPCTSQSSSLPILQEVARARWSGRRCCPKSRSHTTVSPHAHGLSYIGHLAPCTFLRFSDASSHKATWLGVHTTRSSVRIVDPSLDRSSKGHVFCRNVTFVPLISTKMHIVEVHATSCPQHLPDILWIPET